MEATVNYLLQSGLCLLLLCLFYLLVLRTFPRPAYNRLYLLLAPAVAFIIPLLDLSLPLAPEFTLAPALPAIQLPEVSVTGAAPETGAGMAALSMETILLGLYLVGSVALLIRLSIQLFRLRHLIASATTLEHVASEATILQTSTGYTTFAFLRYVLVSPQPHLSAKEQQQVLAHELAHVRLRHTYDVLYYEVLAALLWFNPLVWLLKAELRDVHEYQADAQVLDTYQPQEYTSLLAKEALYKTGFLVGSHFYKPQVFKRLHMLQQHGQRASLLRPLLVLPFLLVLVFLFSTRTVTADITASLSTSEQPAPEQSPTQKYKPESKAPALPADEPAKELVPPAKAEPPARLLPEKVILKQDEQVAPTPASTDEVLLPSSDPEAQKPFAYVENMPHFRGGEKELMKFLGTNIRYPESTREAGREGLVVGTFVVETDGSLTDFKIIKGLDEDADREALRVIEAMSGKWEPGRQDGKVVRVRYTIPIRFAIK